MALIKCLCCSKEISSSARECPHCEVREPHNSKYHLLALALVDERRHRSPTIPKPNSRIIKILGPCPECNRTIDESDVFWLEQKKSYSYHEFPEQVPARATIEYVSYYSDFSDILKCRSCGHERACPQIQCNAITGCNNQSTIIESFRDHWISPCKEHRPISCDRCKVQEIPRTPDYFWRNRDVLPYVAPLVHSDFAICSWVSALAKQQGKEFLELQRRNSHKIDQKNWQNSGRCISCGAALSFWSRIIKKIHECDSCRGKIS